MPNIGAFSTYVDLKTCILDILYSIKKFKLAATVYYLENGSDNRGKSFHTRA